MNRVDSQFEVEVTPHLPVLQKVALRLKGNQMDAEDLVQETLFRALRFWDQFTPGTNCRAWLLRILNNQHINEWRVTSKRAFPIGIDSISETELVRLAKVPVMTSSPEQDMVFKSLDDDLHTAVSQLKGEFRRILLMYFFWDLPYRQIAKLTHLSLGTVKSRVYRGRQILRKSLNEYATNKRYVA